MLYKAVKLNSALIEKCVTGLSSLDNKTQHWLRSAKHLEIDQRLLARLQNVESQQTYAVYIAQLLYYSLRVLQSYEDSERLEGTVDHQLGTGRGLESSIEEDSKCNKESDSNSNSDSSSDSDI